MLTVLGWSFNLDGKLAKAPKFDETKDFNKDDYSLFSIHTHVDKSGFVWVNFDSSKTPIPWEELNAGTDEQPRLQDFYPLDNYVYHRTWTTNGKYNWKLVGDNYNEVSTYGFRLIVIVIVVVGFHSIEHSDDRADQWKLTIDLPYLPSVTTARQATRASPRSPTWTDIPSSRTMAVSNISPRTETTSRQKTLSISATEPSPTTTPTPR